MPAITESTRLSANTWPAMRPRPAPSAARSASSPRRLSPRISNRLATLALAISRTSATAPKSAIIVPRTSPITTSEKGRTTMLKPPRR